MACTCCAGDLDFSGEKAVHSIFPSNLMVAMYCRRTSKPSKIEETEPGFHQHAAIAANSGTPLLIMLLITLVVSTLLDSVYMYCTWVHIGS